MKNFCSLLIIFCSLIANASDKRDDIDYLMESFIECDSRFFSEIALHKKSLEDYAEIQNIDQSQAYIVVPDRNKTNANHHQFTTPINYHSLKITGYYDSALKLGKYGDYYFWGFIIDNTVEEIKTAFNTVVWREMEKELLYTANTKIHYNNDPLDIWHDNANMMIGVKTLPASGTVEKLLLLEKSPEMTLLVCSVQGFFPPKLLQTIRPDIKLNSIDSNNAH